MKRTLLFFLFCLPIAVVAQNIQLHYDLGRTLYNDLNDRMRVTSTVEMFKADKFGSTYFFVDIDYHSDGVKGAYWEVSRELNLTKNEQFAAHVEYDGGITSDRDALSSSRFQHVALVGGAWNWHSADYSRTFSLQALYRYCFNGKREWLKPYNSFQLTEVWNIDFCNRRYTFSGYCDLWYDRNVRGKWAICSEPQFWFNFDTLKGLQDVHLSVGSEVELSYNFVYDDAGRCDKFRALPTLGMKWTF